jgi:aryl-alcohol dehydrogenase-like predicted oxidoreductase
LVEDLLGVAKAAGMSLAQLALAFVQAHPAVTSVVLGVRNLEQLRDLSKAADLRLSEDILDAIDKIVPPGELVEEADRGWILPWMSAEARRRCAGKP